MPRELFFQWEWRLRARPDQLWPYVADTDRFNRDTGLPAVRRLNGGRRHLGFSRFGVRVEWDEEPFEWVRPIRFGVIRRYRTGLSISLRVLVELVDDHGGTRLIYCSWVRPRGALGWLIVPVGMILVNRALFGRVFQQYDRLAQRPSAPALPSGPVRLTSGASQRLIAARRALEEQTADPALVAPLIGLVERGPDEVVNRIRPYALSDAIGLPRRKMLELHLRATRAGLLDLRWDLLCPLCRGAKGSSDELSSLPARVHCDVCNIDVSADYERAVELTFRPNPSIRQIEVGTYCVGGPGVTPHIVVQQRLTPGERRSIAPRLDLGRHRIRVLGTLGVRSLEVANDGAAAAVVAVTDAGVAGSELCLQPAPGIEIANQTTSDQLVVIERTAWNDQAVSAADVTSLQAFRDLFSRELLRRDEQISVGALTILFTDLRESTRFYRQIGDAPAFGRVLDHFAVLRQAVEAAEGALVKTMGDAIMAVFPRASQAVQSVLVAQQRLASTEPALHLKAGMHAGPCLVVTLNERLDYFGTTVNFAARLERFSTGDDVVVSEAVYSDPEIQQLVRDQMLAAQPLEVEVKGFEGKVRVWRLRATGNQLTAPTSS